MIMNILISIGDDDGACDFDGNDLHRVNLVLDGDHVTFHFAHVSLARLDAGNKFSSMCTSGPIIGSQCLYVSMLRFVVELVKALVEDPS